MPAGGRLASKDGPKNLNAMKKSYRITTDETFTTRDGRIVRFEDIFEGIDNNVRSYGANGGKDMSKEDLEDIFQDTSAKVIAAKAGFDLDRCHGCPQAYGSRAATFLERDAFKKAEKHRSIFSPLVRTNKDDEEYEYQADLDAGDEYKPDRQFESKEAQAYIWDKVGSLSEKHRRVLGLAANGYKPREMAKILGCKPQEVSLTLHRARLALKKALGAEFLRHYGRSA